MSSLLNNLARRFMNPPVLLFAGVMTPVLILAWNCQPPPVEQLQAEMRERYGYQYEKRTRDINNKALAAMWEARHDDISRTTLHVPVNTAAVAAGAGAKDAPAAPAKKQ